MHPEYVNQTLCLLQTSNTLLAKIRGLAPPNPAFDQAGRQGQSQSQS
jgi:hypothetical protein